MHNRNKLDITARIKHKINIRPSEYIPFSRVIMNNEGGIIINNVFHIHHLLHSFKSLLQTIFKKVIKVTKALKMLRGKSKINKTMPPPDPIIKSNLSYIINLPSLYMSLSSAYISPPFFMFFIISQ